MCAFFRRDVLLEAMLPAVCPGCGLALPGSQRGLCVRCRGELLPLGVARCHRCGRPLSGMEELCLECLESPPLSDGGVIWGEYQGVLRRALLALKHGGHDELAPLLGGMLAVAVAGCPWLGDIDLLTVVPSHRWHQLRRGYSAAGLIAEEVARGLDLKYSSLLRRRGLGRQARKSRSERLKLGASVFSLRRGMKVEGLNILVLDDVMTTGTTMRRVTGLLKAAGAGRIFTAVLAWSAPSGSWG